MRFALRLGNCGTRYIGSALSLTLARRQRCLPASPLGLGPRVRRPGATLRTSPVCQGKAVRLTTKLSLRLALLLWAPLAVAQSNLGELLDAGAKRLSAEEFRAELVQRILVGPTASGGSLEVLYTVNGVIAGTGTGSIGGPAGASHPVAPISGEWTIDDAGRVCTSMRIVANIGPGGGITLPSRCEFWFKYAEQYFFSVSDSDRRARVLSRTVKQ
jgi:hypothetical protein